jgi:hypothetical protein
MAVRRGHLALSVAVTVLAAALVLVLATRHSPVESRIPARPPPQGLVPAPRRYLIQVPLTQGHGPPLAAPSQRLGGRCHDTLGCRHGRFTGAFFGG